MIQTLSDEPPLFYKLSPFLSTRPHLFSVHINQMKKKEDTAISLGDETERTIRDLCDKYQMKLFESPEWVAAGEPALSGSLEPESARDIYPLLSQTVATHPLPRDTSQATNVWGGTTKFIPSPKITPSVVPLHLIKQSRGLEGAPEARPKIKRREGKLQLLKNAEYFQPTDLHLVATPRQLLEFVEQLTEIHKNRI
jgi:hypothetical protein